MPCTQILHEKTFFFALVIEKEEKGKESSNPHPYPRPLVPTMGLNALKEVLTLKVHTTSTHSQSQMLAGSRKWRAWVTSLQPGTLLREPGVNGLFKEKTAFSDRTPGNQRLT